MKINTENKCRFCSKAFCCVDCRLGHEVRDHFQLFRKVVNCDLCNGKKNFVLKKNVNESIDHLLEFHLPLRCDNCSFIFNNKDDLIAAHTCVLADRICNEQLNSKMGFEYEGKIKPIMEEEGEQEQEVEKNKPNNGSVADASSVNNSDNRLPTTNLVRQTSTPMTKLLHEVKRNSYESMSASSIQMSSIENCSSENDVSPPVPMVTPHLNNFKPPTRRMPISEVPFRHVMTKSVQRAFNNPLYVGTPPLDLRTTPVMRRTNSMEGNVKRPLLGRQTESNAIESQTTPVIRRTRKLERKNLAVAIDDRKDSADNTRNDSERNKLNETSMENSKVDDLEKIENSLDKSSNTFFETCENFESSATMDTPSPTNVKRSSSFSLPAPSNNKVPAGFSFEPSVSDIDMEKSTKSEASKGFLWSLVSSVFRFTGTGGAPTDPLPLGDNNSLIRRCASFTGGILPKKPVLKVDDDGSSHKRRRTATVSKFETEYVIGNDCGPQRRINGRPPINRMRQS